jgi:hypothetical protein
MKKKELLKRIERIEKQIEEKIKEDIEIDKESNIFTIKNEELNNPTQVPCDQTDTYGVFKKQKSSKEGIIIKGIHIPDCSEGGLSLNKEKDIDFFEWFNNSSVLKIDKLFNCSRFFIQYLNEVIRLTFKNIDEEFKEQDKHQLARAILIYEINKVNNEYGYSWTLNRFQENEIYKVETSYAYKFEKKLSNYNGINVWDWFFGIKED